jgi:hypothetical protein
MLPEYTVSEFLSSSRGIRCRITLGDEATRRLLQSVYAWAVANLLSLSYHRMHKARDVCGADNWKSLPSKGGVRNYAGMCLAFLEASKSLPLRMHKTKSGKGSRHYWIQLPQSVGTVRLSTPPQRVVLSGKDIVVKHP